jgi:PAS domain S-box-containing protein
VITARKFTDHMFTGLLEAAPDAMVCVEAGGRIALVNAQTERMFGYRRDELIGRPVEILVPEAARAVHPGHRTRYAADPQPRPMGAEMELAGRRRDGTTFPAEISLSAIDTDEGMLVTAAVRDVTGRRLAAETTARLASIIQSSHDAVIGKTLDQVVTSWNPGAERLYGYTAEEMIGRHIQLLIPAEDRAEESRLLAAVAHGARLEEHLARRVRKDGTTLSVTLTISPIADSQGKLVGLSTVARDVTERQRAEARFTGVLEAAPDAMVCVDAGGRIALVNAQTERVFGYPRDELIGQPVEILVPEGVRAVHPGHRGEYAANPRPRPMGAGMELAGRRRDGTTFPAEISLSAIETDDGILILAAVRDVTERLEIEAQNQRMKDEFIATVSHELRTPLAAISGWLYTLLDGEAGQLAEEQRRYLAIIQRNSDRLARLVGDLLLLGQIESGRLSLELADVDLAQIARDTADLLSGQAAAKRITLTVSAAAPAVMRGDPARLGQVLDNLVTNAIKFTPEEGNVRISVENAGGRCRITVSDTGIGIAPDERARLFERFYRASSATSQGIGGTGLGLAISKAVVESHHGTIQLAGRDGPGSAFVVELPLATREEARA